MRSVSNHQCPCGDRVDVPGEEDDDGGQDREQRAGASGGRPGCAGPPRATGSPPSRMRESRRTSSGPRPHSVLRAREGRTRDGRPVAGPRATPRRIGLIGGEGSGKTTLAVALAGALPACVVDESLRAFVEREGRTPRRDEQAALLAEQAAREDEAAASCPHAWLVADPGTPDDRRLQPAVLRRRLADGARGPAGGRLRPRGVVPSGRALGRRTGSSATAPATGTRPTRSSRASSARSSCPAGSGCSRRMVTWTTGSLP